MISAIVGNQGSGKTARIVREISELAARPETNIVCIEYGKRFDHQLPFSVRLIDIKEYPIRGYDGLLAFLAGINARDYDITDIFIDSIYKVASEEGQNGLGEFLQALNAFAEQVKVHFTITISEDPENLSEEIHSFITTN